MTREQRQEIAAFIRALQDDYTVLDEMGDEVNRYC